MLMRFRFKWLSYSTWWTWELASTITSHQAVIFHRQRYECRCYSDLRSQETSHCKLVNKPVKCRRKWCREYFFQFLASRRPWFTTHVLLQSSPGYWKKIRLFVRNPAGIHQSKSRCTEKKEKMTEIQPHE